jgi:hypothetical protein
MIWNSKPSVGFAIPRRISYEPNDYFALLSFSTVDSTGVFLNIEFSLTKTQATTLMHSLFNYLTHNHLAPFVHSFPGSVLSLFSPVRRRVLNAPDALRKNNFKFSFSLDYLLPRSLSPSVGDASIPKTLREDYIGAITFTVKRGDDSASRLLLYYDIALSKKQMVALCVALASFLDYTGFYPPISDFPLQP